MGPSHPEIFLASSEQFLQLLSCIRLKGYISNVHNKKFINFLTKFPAMQFVDSDRFLTIPI
jgi:hypothetical protein